MSSRKTLKSVEIKVPNNVKVTVNDLNRKSINPVVLSISFTLELFSLEGLE